MKGAMIYPGNGATKKVETFFVEGFKFEVCELHESHFEYIAPNGGKPKGRYFLAVEDSHIVHYSIAEKYHAQTGHCRYDFFCTSRSECLEKIKTFERVYTEVSTAAPKTEDGKARLQGKIDFIAALFGIKLKQ